MKQPKANRSKTNDAVVAALPAKPLSEAERAELRAYAERHHASPHAPRFDALAEDKVSLPTGDSAELFRARLALTIGSVDEIAINHLLTHAAYATEIKDVAASCNTAAALLAGIAPRNEIEGMLAVQMVAAHNVALAMARRTLKADRVDSMAQYGNLAAKLMNVYTRQLEALAKLRGQTGKQTVRVEHVTVQAGGQAVVGNVQTGGRGGDVDGDAEQPHTPRRPHGLAETPWVARDWLRNGNPPGDPTTAPRCRARTRRGTACQGPCVRGRPRCRMHGGATGSGAPRGTGMRGGTEKLLPPRWTAGELSGRYYVS